MASFEYVEILRETDLRNGYQREFIRKFRAEGDGDEVLALTQAAFTLMPKYKYPMLSQGRDEIVRKLLWEFNNDD